MYSNARIVNNLAKLCSQYTDDLAQPFHENCMENAEAETPILLILDVCVALGMDVEQTRRVMGDTGTDFVAYLNAPIDTECGPEMVNAYGMLVPVAGEVGEGSVIVLNEYGQEVLG